MNSRLALRPVQEEASDERRGDRRRTDRRTARRTFDPLFAATLVNQIAPVEATRPLGYQMQQGPRAGIAFNLSA
jgi:hypothetical protein